MYSLSKDHQLKMDKQRQKYQEGRPPNILVYNCFEAKVIPGGDRVVCRFAKFRAGDKDGTLSAATVIEGVRPRECQGCEHYRG
jgi:hypothetical protein